MVKPYVCIFSDRRNFTWNLHPLFAYLNGLDDLDVSMVGLKEDRTWGLKGPYSGVPYCKNLHRRPNLIVTNHAWWDEGYKVCRWALRAQIPVVAIEHGCTMVHSTLAKYRRNIGLATRKCLWSEINMQLMKRYSPANERVCIITGNPRYDELQNFQPRDLELPDEFALVLSTWSLQKDLARTHANQLSEFMPVVVKVHPNETFYAGRDPKRVVSKQVRLVYDQNSLFTLLFRAKLVVTTISSAMIPAILWGKPIFLVNQSHKNIDLTTFKMDYSNVFNFKPTLGWTEAIIRSGIEADPDKFYHFGHHQDGKNCERVVDVVRSLL